MSLIKPFRALRPGADKAKQVSCVPYDVADEIEVRAFLQDNPLSFLRVTRPEAEFADSKTAAIDDVLLKAKSNLANLIDAGVFEQDAQPSLYFYRLASGTHSQTGIVACCSLDEYESGLIKRHEKTRPDKVADRTRHMLTLRAQTGLIFLTYRGTEKIRAMTERAIETPPLYDFETTGIRHTVWRASKTEDLTAAFSEVPALYIADGHHRAESACKARHVLRNTKPDHTGDEDYNFVVSGLFPADELRIQAYNRVVADLNDLSEEEFISQLRENFTVVPDGESEPEKHGEIGMYLDGKWYTLRFNGNGQRASDPIERLDVSILQHYILGPILGIDDPRTDTRIGFVGGVRGAEALMERVDEGSARVAFSLFPTTMEDLFAVSDMGEIMPPKSTWFEPKLKDGLFVHKI